MEQVRNPSPLFSRYFATSTDRSRRQREPQSSARKYSRQHLEVLASPTNFFRKTNKPSIFELLRDQFKNDGTPREEKQPLGTYAFRVVPRELHKQKDECLPPNYEFVERASPAPNFKNSPKKETLFARIRPMTPIEFNTLQSPTNTDSKSRTPHGFTSFAKMSSRPELFRFNQGANEKRFENSELYSWDRKLAEKCLPHRKIREFRKTAPRPELFKPTLEYMPDYSPNYEAVHKRFATYTFH